ncbi:TraR/DksA C4-type zinc finger protein [Maridesulfovibrio ferrireducens]|uniref:TraR/DksA C4-type zinc finger protein n=1 Tax=Maridesulfovibrio ferrireducens TaxID=246191 RepID=UPI001A21C046|nr:TraR/DksA C4-type zinc finger protein [Maridesulfovibrio ferrireducens]MBI9109906.1 TraR/DksA C4-type zinc finger protein [Maridesulfovibrio ferrireducens]
MDIVDAAQGVEKLFIEAALANRLSCPNRPSNKYCEECGEEIPEARRVAIPGVRYCIKCQTEMEQIQ